MADEQDLDLKALDRALGIGEGSLDRPSGPSAAPLHGEQMEPELIEALPSSPGRPSESYEPAFPNWALEGSNAQKLPGSGLACNNCPQAVWMTGAKDLQAFCLILRSITWSTEGASMQIEICNGKEMAIAAMQERQAQEQLKEELKEAVRPSR
jgi:hypothetical protein